MSEVKRVIRMDPKGSPLTGLGGWNTLTHENIVSGDARDRAYEVYTKDLAQAARIRVGVWEAKAYKEKL